MGGYERNASNLTPILSVASYKPTAISAPRKNCPLADSLWRPMASLRRCVDEGCCQPVLGGRSQP